MTSKLDPCRTEEPEGWSVITSAEALPSQLFRDDGVSMEKKKKKTDLVQSLTPKKSFYLVIDKRCFTTYLEWHWWEVDHFQQPYVQACVLGAMLQCRRCFLPVLPPRQTFWGVPACFRCCLRHYRKEQPGLLPSSALQCHWVCRKRIWIKQLHLQQSLFKLYKTLCFLLKRSIFHECAVAILDQQVAYLTNIIYHLCQYEKFLIQIKIRVILFCCVTKALTSDETIIQHLKISSSQIKGVNEVFTFLIMVLDFFFFLYLPSIKKYREWNLHNHTCGSDRWRRKGRQCTALFLQSSTSSSENPASPWGAPLENSMMHCGHITSNQWGGLCN